jgi:hypothetical protein
MAGITGQGNTFNLPNFVGPLFNATPEDTPLLSAIGGLTGGMEAEATTFGWQGYDLRSEGQNVALEGANAPTAQERVRFSVTNVAEIHQEVVEVSYTKQSTPSQVSPQGFLGSNPVQNELAFQLRATLAEIARDVDYSFINGNYNLPTDNTTARATRGILQAITTNASVASTTLGTGLALAASGDTVTKTAHGLSNGAQVQFPVLSASNGLSVGKTYYVVGSTANTFQVALTAGGAAVDITADSTATVAVSTAVTTDIADLLMQSIYDNGGISVGETATILVPSTQKRLLTKAYATANNFHEQSRNVGGLNLQTIETDFGVLNIMMDRRMPKDTVVVLSLEDLVPRFLNVPGKGFLFAEPLAKVGAADRVQVYGEIGLEYGNERKHGKITGLAIS